MKRSSQLALVTMAGVAVLGYFWFSQNEAEPEMEGTIYTSMDDCLYAGSDAATCKARFDEATEAYKKTAPRFVSLQDCERDFGAGACTPANTAAATAATLPNVNGSSASAPTTNSETTASSETRSYFMPAMMGFMAARMMSGGNMQQSYTASPLYGCNGAASGAGGRCYTGASGRSYYGSAGSRTVKAPVSEFRSNANRSFRVVSRGASVRSAASPVASRGGFGGSSRSYSGSSYGG